MKEQQFKKIIEWQKETFVDATPMSKLIHLIDEVNELKDALTHHVTNRRHEFADCILLIFGAASVDGMSYVDICRAIDEKMEINKKRKWGKPDKNGVVNHIKD